MSLLLGNLCNGLMELIIPLLRLLQFIQGFHRPKCLIFKTLHNNLSSVSYKSLHLIHCSERLFLHPSGSGAILGHRVHPLDKDSICMKPLTTYRALYSSSVSSTLNFFFKNHLQPIALQSPGRSTSFRTLLVFVEPVSSLIVFNHCSNYSERIA